LDVTKYVVVVLQNCDSLCNTFLPTALAGSRLEAARASSPGSGRCAGDLVQGIVWLYRLEILRGWLSVFEGVSDFSDACY